VTAGLVDGEGLLITGQVLRFGPLPPAAGPARFDWCIEHGIVALVGASRSFGACLLCVMTHLPDGPESLPEPYMLEELHSQENALRIGRWRVEQWFGLRRNLDSIDASMQRQGLALFDSGWHKAETLGRAALRSAADAYNWLEDAQLDLGADTYIDISSFFDMGHAPQAMSELVRKSHALVHRAGELVGGLFGCNMQYEDGRWFDECIVDLMHLRLGNSPGMSVRFTCSICLQDPGDCEHEPGRPYPLEACGSDDGLCNICDAEECAEHIPGRTYQAIAGRKITDANLREVSLTGRPRDPLARIAGRSVGNERMIRHLGRLPKESERVLDHSCMYPCHGFRGMPADE
jgi:hypothetical protein